MAPNAGCVATNKDQRGGKKKIEKKESRTTQPASAMGQRCKMAIKHNSKNERKLQKKTLRGKTEN